MFCNLDRFVFCAHTQDLKLPLQNLKLILKIHEEKTTALWNRAARMIILSLKNFFQGMAFLYLYIYIYMCYD